MSFPQGQKRPPSTPDTHSFVSSIQVCGNLGLQNFGRCFAENSAYNVELGRSLHRPAELRLLAEASVLKLSGSLCRIARHPNVQPLVRFPAGHEAGGVHYMSHGNGVS